MVLVFIQELNWAHFDLFLARLFIRSVLNTVYCFVLNPLFKACLKYARVYVR